jgi:hypothetical protein
MSATVAAAEPAPASPAATESRGLVGGGVLVAGDEFLNIGGAVELGLQIPQTPLIVHALGSLGSSGDGEGSGDFARIIGGIEANTCRPGRAFCVFVGIDVGYQRQTWSKLDEMEDHRGLLVGPRLGFDAGGDHTRVRLSLDLPSYRHESSVSDTRWQSSDGLTLSLIRRL